MSNVISSFTPGPVSKAHCACDMLFIEFLRLLIAAFFENKSKRAVGKSNPHPTKICILFDCGLHMHEHLFGMQTPLTLDGETSQPVNCSSQVWPGDVWGGPKEVRNIECSAKPTVTINPP